MKQPSEPTAIARRVAALEQENSELKKALVALQAQIRNLEADNAALQAENSRLQAEVAQLQAAHSDPKPKRKITRTVPKYL